MTHLTKNYQVREWVIGGPKVVRERFIKEAGIMAKAIAGFISTPLKSSSSEVMQASLEAIQSFERAREERLVEGLLARAARSERAGVGLEAALRALQEGRAELMIVNNRKDAEILACNSCGRLFDPVQIRPDDMRCLHCNSNGLTIKSLRVILPLEAQKHGATLEIIRGRAAQLLEPLGGIGAIWRY